MTKLEKYGIYRVTKEENKLEYNCIEVCLSKLTANKYFNQLKPIKNGCYIIHRLSKNYKKKFTIYSFKNPSKIEENVIVN